MGPNPRVLRKVYHGCTEGHLWAQRCPLVFREEGEGGEGGNNQEPVSQYGKGTSGHSGTSEVLAASWTMLPGVLCLLRCVYRLISPVQLQQPRCHSVQEAPVQSCVLERLILLPAALCRLISSVRLQLH